MADSVWLSIITVVKDDAAGLRRTAQSMKQQQLAGVEWLIIDGSSDSAQTSAVLRDNEVNAKVIGQSPQGIYAAMNEGLSAAKGTYAYFLNAGDSFADAQVVATLCTAVRDPDPDWLFGPVRIVEANGRKTVTPTWNYAEEQRNLFARGKFPSHQGTLAKRTLMLSFGGFDVRYRIAADYVMALRLSQVSAPEIVTFPIAEFREGGVSTTQWKQSFREFHQARRQVFHPVGTMSLREPWNTALHFSRVFLHRDLGLSSRRASE